ncbi:acetate uptake transporter [Methanimicrococcus sp. OttesenSCG-928-J09]|nr:acetate uptake transporter [Methanimicrococcus sp. OttesenSCG-928-J09]
MSDSEQVVRICDSWATPGALGLTGFSMTTLMLAFFDLGLFSDALALISMSIFVGGIAQFCAGLMAFKKGNTFETVAFCAFGSFWISFAYILIAPFGSDPASATSVGLYLLVWGLLAGSMLFGVIKLKAKFLIAVFALLALVFIVTAIFYFTGIAIIATVAGILALILGLVAFYTAMTIVLNECGYKLPC